MQNVNAKRERIMWRRGAREERERRKHVVRDLEREEHVVIEETQVGPRAAHSNVTFESVEWQFERQLDE